MWRIRNKSNIAISTIRTRSNRYPAPCKSTCRLPLSRILRSGDQELGLDMVQLEQGYRTLVRTPVCTCSNPLPGDFTRRAKRVASGLLTHSLVKTQETHTMASYTASEQPGRFSDAVSSDSKNSRHLLPSVSALIIPHTGSPFSEADKGGTSSDDAEITTNELLDGARRQDMPNMESGKCYHSRSQPDHDARPEPTPPSASPSTDSNKLLKPSNIPIPSCIWHGYLPSTTPGNNYSTAEYISHWNECQYPHFSSSCSSDSQNLIHPPSGANCSHNSSYDDSNDPTSYFDFNGTVSPTSFLAIGSETPKSPSELIQLPAANIANRHLHVSSDSTHVIFEPVTTHIDNACIGDGDSAFLSSVHAVRFNNTDERYSSIHWQAAHARPESRTSTSNLSSFLVDGLNGDGFHGSASLGATYTRPQVTITRPRPQHRQHQPIAAGPYTSASPDDSQILLSPQQQRDSIPKRKRSRSTDFEDELQCDSIDSPSKEPNMARQARQFPTGYLTSAGQEPFASARSVNGRIHTNSIAMPDTSSCHINASSGSLAPASIPVPLALGT